MKYTVAQFIFPLPSIRTVPRGRLPKSPYTSVVETIMSSAATQYFSLHPLPSNSFNPKVMDRLVSCLCSYSVVQLFTNVCVLTVWYSFLQVFVFLQCGTAFYRCLCSYSVVQLFTNVCVLTVWFSFLQMFVFLQCGTAFYKCLCSYSVVQLITDVCVLTVWYSFLQIKIVWVNSLVYW
jgi:hypothetical protein